MQELGIWILVAVLTGWLFDYITRLPDNGDPIGESIFSLLPLFFFACALVSRIIFLLISAWF